MSLKVEFVDNSANQYDGSAALIQLNVGKAVARLQ